jgi:hypothetical protein
MAHLLLISALAIRSPTSPDAGIVAQMQWAFTACEPVKQRACAIAPGAALLSVSCEDPGGNHGQGGGEGLGVELRTATGHQLLEAQCDQSDGEGCKQLPELRCAPGVLVVDGLTLNYDAKSDQLTLDPLVAAKVEALWGTDAMKALAPALDWAAKLDWLPTAASGVQLADQTAHLLVARGFLAAGKLDRASAQVADWSAASPLLAQRRADIVGAIDKERERLAPMRVVTQASIGHLVATPRLPPNLTPTLFWRKGKLCVGQGATMPNPTPRLTKPVPYYDGIESAVVDKDVRCYDPAGRKWGRTEPSALPLPGPILTCENGGYAFQGQTGCSVGPRFGPDAPDFLASQVVVYLSNGVLIDGSRETEVMGELFDGGFGVIDQQGLHTVTARERVPLFRQSAGTPGVLMNGALTLDEAGATQRRSDPEKTFPLLPTPPGTARWTALLPSPDQRYIAAVEATPKLGLWLYEIAPTPAFERDSP